MGISELEPIDLPAPSEGTYHQANACPVAVELGGHQIPYLNIIFIHFILLAQVFLDRLAIRCGHIPIGTSKLALCSVL